MSETIPMKGATLKIEISETPTKIEGITSIDDIVSVENPMIESSPLDAANDTFVAGRPALGTLSFKGNWDPAQTTHQALFTRAQSGGSQVILATLANTGASEVEITGPIKTFAIKGGDKGAKATFECVVTINAIAITP